MSELKLSSTTNSNLAYRNFIDTCKTTATRDLYVRVLRYFIEYLQLPPDSYDKLLETDVKITQMNICDYVKYLRNKGKSHQTISSYLAAVRHFFEMNDIVTINWRKIHSFEGEPTKSEDRPYTHSEISAMLQNATLRNRAIILLMSSSGSRVGAIPLVRIKDLEPIDKYNIYKVTYYPQSKKSAYFSFCSTEARKEIDTYLKWRERQGERLKPESPLFRTEFSNLQVQHPRPLGRAAIQFIIYNLLKITGIRTVEPSTEFRNKRSRTHIMECHALRKFFETNAFRAGMDHMYLRRLMGHGGKSGNLEDAYLKLSEEELLEGDSKHVGYIGIIDQLTIDDSNKLRREVQTLKIRADRLEQVMSDIEEVKKRIGI